MNLLDHSPQVFSHVQGQFFRNVLAKAPATDELNVPVAKRLVFVLQYQFRRREIDPLGRLIRNSPMRSCCVD